MEKAQDTAKNTKAPPLVNGGDADNVRPLIQPDRQADEAILDAYARLEAETTLDADDGDEPGVGKEEIAVIEVVDKLPRFAKFRANPETVFDMWATIDEHGLNRRIIAVTKAFAPLFEEELTLRRCRFYETVTTDGVIRLFYCFIPETDRTPNTWIASKAAALEAALTEWTTMRIPENLNQYTHRKTKRDHGEPKFSGMSKGELIQRALRKPGLLVEDDSHPFYRKAADLDDE